MPRNTLLDFFEDFASLDTPFLVYDDGFRTSSYRYSEVATLARAFAARLQAARIEPDQKIILYSENRPEWIIALWGCLLAGVVAVPLDFRSSPEFVRRIGEIVSAQAILIGDEVELPPSLAPSPPTGPDVWRISELAAAQPPVPPSPAPVTRDTIAQIIFTSGATADPKGVVITHRNILANIVPVEGEVLKYRKWARPFAPVRFLNLLPLSHMFGQAMATFIPPMLPGVVVFMRGYSPAEIIRQIHTRRVSVLVSVPKILDVLEQYLVHRWPDLALAGDEKMHWLLRWWRYRKVHHQFGWKFWSFIVGAAPLPPEAEAFWSKLGFLVIQGYGLTETAPIVTLNHPFHAHKGSVGKPIAGVAVRIAPDGEILVRGDNVTSGYFGAPEATAQAFEEGWFHTGDVGAMDATGQLRILGRKKEMIVTPEGLNVFPEDVERVLKQTPGVRDAAVIGTARVHAVLILDPAVDRDQVVRIANTSLADYQRVRTASTWPYAEFPRTEGTGKLKRHEIAQGTPPAEHSSKIDFNVPLESLTSLERVERMVALGMNETELSAAAPGAASSGDAASAALSIDFPRWTRSRPARLLRRLALPGFLLPLVRIFAHIRVEGLENLAAVQPPVIFAPTHQSYLDVPVILAALPSRWRYRIAPAMSKEFFQGHFHGRSFTNSLNYYLAGLFFNAFPIPQREAGALESLRYMGELAGEGYCILIFPEGRMTDTGGIAPFQPGVGLLGSKLQIPVVPVRVTGLDKVLHRTWKMARPGRVIVRFGAALQLSGADYQALANQVQKAVEAGR